MMKNIIFFALLILLAGCTSSVTKIDHYKISLEKNSPDQKPYKQGLAFVNNSICLWAKEGQSKDDVLVSVGPEFLPVLPMGFQKSKPQPGYFQLNVWLVPDRKSDGMSFDPRKLKLTLRSGKDVSPVRAEFWRKHTIFRKRPSLIWPQSDEEIVIPSGDTVTQVRPMEPIKLSSYVISWIDFKYPNEDVPVGIIFNGFQDSDSNPLKPIYAELNKSVDYSYRGLATLLVGDLTPLEACRGLLEEQKSPN